MECVYSLMRTCAGQVLSSTSVLIRHLLRQCVQKDRLASAEQHTMSLKRIV